MYSVFLKAFLYVLLSLFSSSVGVEVTKLKIKMTVGDRFFLPHHYFWIPALQVTSWTSHHQSFVKEEVTVSETVQVCIPSKHKAAMFKKKSDMWSVWDGRFTRGARWWHYSNMLMYRFHCTERLCKG